MKILENFYRKGAKNAKSFLINNLGAFGILAVIFFTRSLRLRLAMTRLRQGFGGQAGVI